MAGNRRSIRLQKYNYAQEGAYFITLCVHERSCLFGEVVDGIMRLNFYANKICSSWRELPAHFPSVTLDEFVIMPNHLHGILIFNDVGPTLGQVVAYFKYQTTKFINSLRNTPQNRLWQRNYFEHVIRNEKDMVRVREYIFNNPLQWHLDTENPRYKS